MTDYQNYIALSRYARYREDEDRRESWSDTVDRYFDFMRRVSGKPDMALWDESYEAVTAMEVMPSMRALMTAGKALERDHVAGYNCSYLPINHPRCLDEIVYILMCGTGVGFSVESRFTSRLPEVPQLYKTDTTIVVEDSKIGWASAYRELVHLLYAGKRPRWDLSKIRPAGERLRTFGGRASGPDPLNDLFEFTVRKFVDAQNRQLRPIELHDIVCKIGEIVVVGGVRRSAEISLSDLADNELRHAKSGEWWRDNPHRSLANNSAVHDKRPDLATFMSEWQSLYLSRSGERGLFNREAAQKKFVEIGRKWVDGLGTNPCQPGFATVLTPGGIRTFDDIEVGDVIWSGTQWTYVVRKQATGVKPVYRYHTTAGSFIGTENHRVVSNRVKIEAGKAETIDVCRGWYDASWDVYDCQAIMDGLVVGDGCHNRTTSKPVLLCIGDKDQDYFTNPNIKRLISHRYDSRQYVVTTTITKDELPDTFARTIPDRYFYGDRCTVRSFLRGLYSANGSVLAKHGRVTLKAASFAIIERAQLMLSALGIKSYYTTNKPSSVKFANGTYMCKKSYDLNITTDIDRFSSQVGFIQNYKQEALDRCVAARQSFKDHKTSYDIKEVQYLGEFPVYDITVGCDEHTYWTGGLRVSNCGEILLRPFQFCNLTEAIIRPDDKLKDLKRKVRIATFLGTVQSTLTNFRYLRAIWRKNCEEERLLGVSLTGIMTNTLTAGYGNGALLRELRETAREENLKYAEILGINPSAAITCVKPSGTVSQLVNTSSGIHPAYAEYYIRRVQCDVKDPLTTFMINAGVPHEPLSTKPDQVMVLEFPQKSSPGAVTRHDLVAIKQLEIWHAYRTHWCDHNPSCTVYVREDEWLDVAAWVWRNFDDCAGLSFLPYDGGTYKQAPYEEIDAARYDELVKAFPAIPWPDFKEHGDNTVGSQELACTGGQCDI